MDKKTLFRTAWTLARQAAARLGGTVRAHFGACLKTAWAVSRAPQIPEVVAAPVADEVPAYTAENSLRAALGPYSAMERFFDAHRTMERGLWLGAWLDGCELQQRDRHLLSVEERTEYVEYVRRDVARAFKVDRSTLQDVVDAELATLAAPVVEVAPEPEAASIVEAAPAPVAFRAPIVNSCVRGGGFGARAWIARIVGTHPKFTFEREFVEKHANTSRSGRSGSMWWQLPEPGYYEYRGLQYDKDEARIGQLDNCFVEVREDGVIYEATKAEVLTEMKKLETVA